MVGAVTLARVRGIPLRVHWTLLVALPAFAYVIGRYYFATDPTSALPGAAALTWGAALAVFLFTTVLLHELGHSLVAKRQGVDVEHVTLFPLGGVSGLTRTPRAPRAEMALTAMGPLVNLVIGFPLVALAWAITSGDLFPVQTLPHSVAFLTWAGFLSLFIGAFNLLVPAFPLDGGRLLRAGLALFMDFGKATRIAAHVGRLLAVLMALAGFYAGIVLLVLVAVFVWAGAGAEASQVKRETARGTPAGHG